MSQKFGKDRSVDFGYHAIPLKYTGIINPKNSDKELVLMDYFGKHYSAAWRNNKTNKVGITFLLRTIEGGFVFKDKEYLHKDSGKGFVF